MKQVTINVYEYSELPAYIQEKLKNREIEYLVDENFANFNTLAPEELGERYGIDAKVYYSLAYQQGDGLHFHTANFFTEQVITEILKNFNSTKEEFQNIQKLANLLGSEEFGIPITGKSRHYEYCTPNDIDFPDEDDVEEAYRELYPADMEFNVKDCYAEIQKYAIQFYSTLCNELEVTGYESYDVTDEQLNESLNSRYYYEDGRYYGPKEEDE